MRAVFLETVCEGRVEPVRGGGFGAEDGFAGRGSANLGEPLLQFECFHLVLSLPLTCSKRETLALPRLEGGVGTSPSLVATSLVVS